MPNPAAPFRPFFRMIRETFSSVLGTYLRFPVGVNPSKTTSLT